MSLFSALMINIAFLLFFLGLSCFFLNLLEIETCHWFSTFLSLKYMSLLMTFIYILIRAFSPTAIPFSIAVATFYKFWYIVFSLGSKYLVSILISSMICGLFNHVLLNFQTFGGFLFMLLVFVSHLMLLWSKKLFWFWSFKSCWGLPWWLSNKEFDCRCGRHGFNPCFGKIPHAVE